MIIHQCDRCGVKATQLKGERASKPKEWQTVALQGGCHPCYEVCPACAEKLGLATLQAEQNLGDKLLEILEDMMTDIAEQAANP